MKDIYVIAVNDVFVVKAWKKKLEEEHGVGESKIHFVADSTGEWTKGLGLEFDATGLLGGVRSKRYAAVVSFPDSARECV